MVNFPGRYVLCKLYSVGSFIFPMEAVISPGNMLSGSFFGNNGSRFWYFLWK